MNGHIRWVFFLAVGLFAASQVTSQSSEHTLKNLVPEPRLSGTVITWPADGARQLVVVESPNGDQLRGWFEPWEPPSLDLSDLLVLVDGSYQYSHRLLPADEGERPILRGGSFRVLGGRLQTVEPELAKHPSGFHRESQPLTESSSDPFLWLNDTSPNGSGTDDDWFIWVDGSGTEEFSIYGREDQGPLPTLTRTFRIERNVDDYALYVDASANGFAEIGVNTNTPDATVHALAFRPNVKLEPHSAFEAWELSNDNQGVFCLAEGFDEQLRIQPGAPNSSIRVDSSGNVGLGTSLPKGNLHISGQHDHDVFSGIGPDLQQGPAFNFGYSGSSYGVGSGFFNARPAAGAVAPNPALYFMTDNVDRMMIDRDGDMAVDMDGTFGNSFDPQHPIHAQQSGAYLSASGVWRDASSRALKDHVAPLALEAALATLQALEPVTYVYEAEPEDEVVGFIAEDVPELVATPDRKTLAPTEIVGVLTLVVQEQQRELEEQQVALLEQRQALQEQKRFQWEHEELVLAHRQVVAERWRDLEEHRREVRALRSEVADLRTQND